MVEHPRKYRASRIAVSKTLPPKREKDKVSEDAKVYTNNLLENERKNLGGSSNYRLKIEMKNKNEDELYCDADIGERIRNVRLERGLKQKELAFPDFSPSYVSAIESGKIKPSLGALEKLASRLEKPVTYFVARNTVNQPASDADIIELGLAQGMALISAGKANEAIKQLEALDKLTLDRWQRATYLFLSGSALVKLERFVEAIEPLQEAQILADKNGQLELAERIRNRLAVAWYQQGRFSQALELLNHCHQAITKGYVVDLDLKLHIISNLAHVHLLQNRPVEAHDLYEEGLLIISVHEGESDDNLNKSLASIYSGLSQAHRNEGQLGQARLYAVKSLVLFDALDNAKLILQMRESLGSILAESGDHEQAELIFRKMYLQATQIGNRSAAAMAQVNLCYLYMRKHDEEKALAAVTLAVQIASECQDKLALGQAHLKKAQIHVSREEKKEACFHFDEAIKLLELVAAHKALSGAYFEYGSYLKQYGDPMRAIEFLEKAYRQSERR